MTEDIFIANGAKFYAKDDVIVRHVRSGQAFETETTAWLFSTVSKGRAYVDVGHSTGWFAVPVAMMGVEVWGFEPLPNAYKRAKENMALNGVDYTLINKAVSDSSGEATFRYKARLPLTSGGTLEPKVHGGNDRMTVEVTTLDETLPADMDVSLIKVDVEGHEINVLRGAEKVIARCRPSMVLEANSHDKLMELETWLNNHDYEWEIVDMRNMICVSK